MPVRSLSAAVDRLRPRRGVARPALAAVALVALVGVAALIVSLGRSGTSATRLVASGATSTSTSGTEGIAPGSVETTGGGGTVLPATAPPGLHATTTVPANAPATGPSPGTLPTGTTRPTLPAATTPSTVLVPTEARVRGTVLFSPTCPVERMPPDPACAPRPGPAHIQLVRGDGTVAAEGDADRSAGQFSIPVAPGSYAVKAAATTVGRGCLATPTQLTVTTGTGSTVAVSCDTGIR